MLYSQQQQQLDEVVVVVVVLLFDGLLLNTGMKLEMRPPLLL
jgi:hypothetical protein